MLLVFSSISLFTITTNIILQYKHVLAFKASVDKLRNHKIHEIYVAVVVVVILMCFYTIFFISIFHLHVSKP